VGEIVGAAIVGHVPTIMLAEHVRVSLGGGRDTTLVAGFGRLRERLDAAAVDTVVIVDTHWFTTAEHIVAGQEHHRGNYTSEELPKTIRNLAYDYRGAPRLAASIVELGRAKGMWVLNATDDTIAHHYPTLNVVHHVVRDERVLSTGVCQTAAADDFIEFGALIAEAVAGSDARVAVLASGGMSHRFWPLREFRDHGSYDPEHVITPEARAADERIIALLEAGEHASVVDLYPEYRAHAPEGRFGHYLTMVGALGGRACTARGERLSDYENSYGTGQIHLWFPCP
jgi:3,4-dihydroxyphenylacetate 2,3-dioxygenase